MRQVRSSNTAPELLVRRILHRSGYRFKLHGGDLPGNPDIILPKYRTVILVHGCFWHRHKNCIEAAMPQSNIPYWEKKFARNVERDRRVKKDLIKLGWRVITVWECRTKNPRRLLAQLEKALTPARGYSTKDHAVPVAAESRTTYRLSSNKK